MCQTQCLSCFPMLQIKRTVPVHIVRWPLRNGSFASRLLASKKRISKVERIVRLELDAAVLSKQLRCSIVNHSQFKFKQNIHIVDSEIVVLWLTKNLTVLIPSWLLALEKYKCNQRIRLVLDKFRLEHCWYYNQRRKSIIIRSRKWMSVWAKIFKIWNELSNNEDVILLPKGHHFPKWYAEYIHNVNHIGFNANIVKIRGCILDSWYW